MLDLCAQSDREGWPGHRLLEALFEHEINEREVRRIERHRNESALTPDKRLSSFDFSAVPSVSKAQVMALAAGTEWPDRGAPTCCCSARPESAKPLDQRPRPYADRRRTARPVRALLRARATPAT